MPLLSIVLDFLIPFACGLFLSQGFSFPFSCGSGYHSVRYGLTRSSLRQLFEKYTDDPVTKLKPDCASQVKVSLMFFFWFCFFVSVFLTLVQQRATIYAILLVGFDGLEGIYLYLYWQRFPTLGLNSGCLVSPCIGALPRTLVCRTESLCCSSKCTVCTQLGCWSFFSKLLGANQLGWCLQNLFWSFREMDRKLRRNREDHISFPAGIWSGRNGVSRAQASDGGELQCVACRT